MIPLFCGVVAGIPGRIDVNTRICALKYVIRYDDLWTMRMWDQRPVRGVVATSNTPGSQGL